MMKKIWNAIRWDLWIVLLDVIAVNLAYYLALLLRYYVKDGFWESALYAVKFWGMFAPFYTVLAVIIFACFRLYGGMWRYAGMNDMNRIIGANVCTTLVHIAGTIVTILLTRGGLGLERIWRMPLSYYGIGALLQFLLISLIRFGYRIVLVEKKKVSGRNAQRIPALVIGAGETARRAIAHLEDTPFRAVMAAGREDDAGKTLNGVRVVADYEEALERVQAVFIADRKLSAAERREIREKCEARGIEVQDYTGALNNLGGVVPVASLLGITAGPVTLRVDGNEKRFASGEEALKELKDRYEVAAVEGATVVLRKPGGAAYAGYDAWAKQHEEDTGEEVTFF